MLRWLEWGTLFVGVPMLLFLNLTPVNRYVFLALATLYALAVVLTEKPRFVAVDRPRPQYLAIRIPAIVTLIFLFSWLAYPADFLSTPQMHPKAWLLILIFYPLVSALPQEFLYRRFYFWRYRDMFSTSVLLLASNVLLFAFMHIIYDNMVAVCLSLLGGGVFALSYRLTGRLLPVWMEHSIYGLAVFTSGLGQFFYRPFS